jgi:peptidoglycan/xylan/chitin deacetylase (PgdA/CDA1 family)
LIKKHLRDGGALVIDESNKGGALEFAPYKNQIFTVPMNLGNIMSDHRYTEKTFSHSAISVQETVARKSKSGARKAVVHAIKIAFWSMNLPFGHLWYYPKGYRSLFSFRFDMDEFNVNDHQTFLKLLEGFRGAISCFACMDTYKYHMDAIKQVVDTGVEIGSHGYIHHVYQNYEQNRWNLQKAKALLNEHVDEVVGFSGPHGKWNPFLQHVLENQRYEYSSEFTLDYDNFPFFPFYENQFSNVLQIPTHPVCEGVFLQQYDFEGKMFETYFNSVIEQKLAIQEPILIFGHPTHRLGRYPEIFRAIQNRIQAEPNIWFAEFREISQWWKRRHRLKFEVTFEDGRTNSSGLTDEFEIHYLLPGEENRWMDRSPDTLTIQESEVHRNAIGQLKWALKLWLDWEIKTDVSDLKVVNFPTLIKKLMRWMIGLRQTKKMRLVDEANEQKMDLNKQEH